MGLCPPNDHYEWFWEEARRFNDVLLGVSCSHVTLKPNDHRINGPGQCASCGLTSFMGHTQRGSLAFVARRFNEMLRMGWRYSA